MSATKSTDIENTKRFGLKESAAALEICRESNNFKWRAAATDFGCRFSVAIEGYGADGGLWRNTRFVDLDELSDAEEIDIHAFALDFTRAAKNSLLRWAESAAVVPHPPSNPER